jgi:hypothetical protein
MVPLKVTREMSTLNTVGIAPRADEILWHSNEAIPIKRVAYASVFGAVWENVAGHARSLAGGRSPRPILTCGRVIIGYCWRVTTVQDVQIVHLGREGSDRIFLVAISSGLGGYIIRIRRWMLRVWRFGSRLV